MKKTIDYYMALPYRLEIVPDITEGGYVARYPELPGCITCSDNFQSILENATAAKREWLLAAMEEGIEIIEPQIEDDLSKYSGQFKLRIPKTLHKSLALTAKAEGISMNQYCLYLLSKNNAVFSHV